MAHDPGAGLDVLDTVATPLRNHHRYHAVRARDRHLLVEEVGEDGGWGPAQFMPFRSR